jgi:predicted nucleic acid-binding protein
MAYWDTSCLLKLYAPLLRTLDAVHLSTAVVAGELEIVATDKRLREAALSLGIAVYPP